jgi:hypothetical protein
MQLLSKPPWRQLQLCRQCPRSQPSAAVQALVDSVGRLHEMMDSRTAAIQQAADVRANSLQASVDALVEQNRAMQAHIDRLSESAGTPLVLTNNGSENHESVSEL